MPRESHPSDDPAEHVAEVSERQPGGDAWKINEQSPGKSDDARDHQTDASGDGVEDEAWKINENTKGST